MEVPRLGVKSELQLPAFTTATATPDSSYTCDLYHSSQLEWVIVTPYGIEEVLLFPKVLSCRYQKKTALLFLFFFFLWVGIAVSSKRIYLMDKANKQWTLKGRGQWLTEQRISYLKFFLSWLNFISSKASFFHCPPVLKMHSSWSWHPWAALFWIKRERRHHLATPRSLPVPKLQERLAREPGAASLRMASRHLGIRVVGGASARWVGLSGSWNVVWRARRVSSPLGACEPVSLDSAQSTRHKQGRKNNLLVTNPEQTMASCKRPSRNCYVWTGLQGNMGNWA